MDAKISCIPSPTTTDEIMLNRLSSESHDEAQPEQRHLDDFKIGCPVYAPYRRSSMILPGHIIAHSNGGMVAVAFDSGDVDYAVSCSSLRQRLELEELAAMMDNAYIPGEKVLISGDTDYKSGRVIARNVNGSYLVQVDAAEFVECDLWPQSLRHCSTPFELLKSSRLTTSNDIPGVDLSAKSELEDSSINGARTANLDSISVDTSSSQFAENPIVEFSDLRETDDAGRLVAYAGARVTAKCGKDNSTRTGKLRRYCGDNFFDIKSDGGTIYRRVHSDVIQLSKMESKGTLSMKEAKISRRGVRTLGGFHVGDTVRVAHTPGRPGCVGKITAIYMDKTCDIVQTDTVMLIRIDLQDLISFSVHEEDLLTMEFNSDDESKKIEVGFYVSAKHPVTKKKVEGTVIARDEDTFDVQFTDGEIAHRLFHFQIEYDQEKNRDVMILNQGVKVGQRPPRPQFFNPGDFIVAKNKYDEAYRSGKVVACNRDRQEYSIVFDDGDYISEVPYVDIVTIDDTVAVPPGPELFRKVKEGRSRGDISRYWTDVQVGDYVMTNAGGPSCKYDIARVVAQHNNHDFDVEFPSGKIIEAISADRIIGAWSSASVVKYKQPVDHSKIFLEGEKCFASFCHSPYFYPGVIRKLNDDGTYDVLYEDGDRDPAVSYECILKHDDFCKIYRKGYHGPMMKYSSIVQPATNLDPKAKVTVSELPEAEHQSTTKGEGTDESPPRRRHRVRNFFRKLFGKDQLHNATVA